MMDRATYQRLRAAADDESLSYGELAEIQGAFDTIPESLLRDRRENATADDMLDEIEAHAAPCGHFEPSTDGLMRPNGIYEHPWCRNCGMARSLHND